MAYKCVRKYQVMKEKEDLQNQRYVLHHTVLCDFTAVNSCSYRQMYSLFSATRPAFLFYFTYLNTTGKQVHSLTLSLTYYKSNRARWTHNSQMIHTQFSPFSFSHTHTLSDSVAQVVRWYKLSWFLCIRPLQKARLSTLSADSLEQGLIHGLDLRQISPEHPITTPLIQSVPSWNCCYCKGQLMFMSWPMEFH